VTVDGRSLARTIPKGTTAQEDTMTESDPHIPSHSEPDVVESSDVMASHAEETTDTDVMAAPGHYTDGEDVRRPHQVPETD